MRCPCCDRQLVRHLSVRASLGEVASFDWSSEAPEAFYWHPEGAWLAVPGVKRFWLPLGPEQLYEAALGQYTLWVEEAQRVKPKDDLVIVSMDLGRVRGRETDPWIGSVLLGAFRGRDLTFIETEVDEPPEWLRWARRWAIEPQSRYLTSWGS